MKLLVLCLCVAVAYGGLAPLHLAKTRGVPDRFIVKLKDASFVDKVASEVLSRFETMRMPAPTITMIRELLPLLTLRIPLNLVNYVRTIDGVEYIEQDSIGGVLASYWSPAWGIDRVDQRSGTDSTFTVNVDYPGKGVKIYAIGTGIQVNHSVFTNRAKLLYGNSDTDGHGTHCAGTAAGATYGIARQATVLSVRVCDSMTSCYVSKLMEGLKAVSKDGAKAKGVVLLPLSFGWSVTVNAAVKQLWDEGFVVTTAAGNAFSNACETSPQSVPELITVAATDKNDRRLSYSSYGSCVDIFAPGTDILSSTFSDTSFSATETRSGTSMACAHVAGAAAMYLSEHSGTSPTDVKVAILNGATKDVVVDPHGSPNKLLYVNF